MVEKYDIVVVGGGLHGSCTAYSLAKKGLKILLLEQFDAKHENGRYNYYKEK